MIPISFLIIILKNNIEIKPLLSIKNMFLWIMCIFKIIIIILGYFLAKNKNSITLITLISIFVFINSIICVYIDLNYNWNYNQLNKTIKVYSNDSYHRKLFMSKNTIK